MKSLIKKILGMRNTQNEYGNIVFDEIDEFIEWNDKYMRKDYEIVLGRNKESEVSFNLNDSPHLIIVADEGYGRTVTLKNILWQMVNKDSEIIIIDPTGRDFTKNYKMFGKVRTRLDEIDETFNLLLREYERRLKLFRSAGCRDIKEYNAIYSEDKIKRMGVFIDNLEAFLVNDKNKNIYELLKISCITGINFFSGIRTHMYNHIPRNIVDNISLKLCTAIYDKKESILIIGNDKATNIKHITGRMILKKDNCLTEFQGYYFDEDTHLNLVGVN